LSYGCLVELTANATPYWADAEGDWHENEDAIAEEQENNEPARHVLPSERERHKRDNHEGPHLQAMNEDRAIGARLLHGG
jgi:hypothetical protein